MVFADRSRATLEVPLIRRFTENSAVWVMIPDSRSRTRNTTWTTPVNAPASIPAAIAAASATQGFAPRSSNPAVRAAPSGNVPSTLKSGKFRTE